MQKGHVEMQHMQHFNNHISTQILYIKMPYMHLKFGHFTVSRFCFCFLTDLFSLLYSMLPTCYVPSIRCPLIVSLCKTNPTLRGIGGWGH